jgi:hypothetical protein
VILCERGVRTFATTRATRSTSPSCPTSSGSRTCRSSWTLARDRQAREGPARSRARPSPSGADGLLIEVHHHPEHALSDGPQAILPEMFAELDVGGAAPGARRRANRVKRDCSSSRTARLPRRGDRPAGNVVRRDRLQHRDERLPGSPDRPVLRRADRRHDGGPHRQLRRSGGRGGVGRVHVAGSSRATSRRAGAARAGREPRRVPGRAGRDGPPRLDTRALVRRIRSEGAMRAGVSTEIDDPASCIAACSRRRRWSAATSPSRSRRRRSVSGGGPNEVPRGRVDYGMKRNIVRLLQAGPAA